MKLYRITDRTVRAMFFMKILQYFHIEILSPFLNRKYGFHPYTTIIKLTTLPNSNPSNPNVEPPISATIINNNISIIGAQVSLYKPYPEINWSVVPLIMFNAKIIRTKINIVFDNIYSLPSHRFIKGGIK